MMKHSLSVGLLLLASLSLGAQNARELIQEMPSRAASNLHSYEFHPIVDTPAPEGFVPVYISHYGRHGSRHDISSNTCDKTLGLLREADSLRLLTKEGRALLMDVRAIAEEHVGMGGELSFRGGREHEQLASRMTGRFPSVFVSGKEVNVVGSTVQRSLVSMAYFMASLRAACPEVVVTMTTGERYSPVTRLSKPSSGSSSRQGRGQQQGGGPRQSVRPNIPDGDFSAFYSKVFENPAEVSSREEILSGVFKVGSLCEDLDFLGVDIYGKYFTTDELYLLWAQENDSLYARWGNSIENGGAYGLTSRPLVDDILDKADAALSGDTVAADLRFGHDQPYMALCSYLGIDADGGAQYHAAEAHEHWNSFEIVPTAANVQFIFYRNAEGKVLVKVLRNEKEVSVPGLTPVAGPYYDWTDFKLKFSKDNEFRTRLEEPERSNDKEAARKPEKFMPVLSSSSLASVSYSDGSFSNFNLSSMDMDWKDNGVKGFSAQISFDLVAKHFMGLNVAYRFAPWLIVKVGEQKMVFFNEITTSPRVLEASGYSLGMSYLGGYTKDICGYGTRSRDWGITAAGNLFQVNGRYIVTYNAGVWQGNGYSPKDDNGVKNLTFLLTVSPFRNFKISAGGMLGKYSIADGEKATRLGDRNRLSGGLWYDDGKYFLKSETVYGKTDALESWGAFVLSGFWFRPNMAIALRGDTFLMDITSNESRISKLELCFSHKITSVLRYRLQLGHTFNASPELNDANTISLGVSYKFSTGSVKN